MVALFLFPPLLKLCVCSLDVVYPQLKTRYL